MKKTIKAIVFDFDGVLGDTWETSVGIMKELKMDFTLDDYKDHHNGNVYEEPKVQFTEEGASYFFKEAEKRASAEKLFPLKNELEEIYSKYKIFIISSNAEAVITRYIEEGEWSSYFERVLGVETDRSKVKKFQMIFDEYEIKPEECVFVTDTLGDLIEGAHVGVKTLAVTWGYHGEMRLKKANPDKIIHDFDELTKTITNYFA